MCAHGICLGLVVFGEGPVAEPEASFQCKVVSLHKVQHVMYKSPSADWFLDLHFS